MLTKDRTRYYRYCMHCSHIVLETKILSQMPAKRLGLGRHTKCLDLEVKSLAPDLG